MYAVQRQIVDEQYRLLIDRISDGIIVTDADGIVRLVNPAAALLLGRSREELIGQPLGLPVIADDFAEINIVRKDSQPAFAELRIVEARWDGRPGFVLSLRDVTERKKAEEALAEKEAQLAQLHKMQAIGQLAGGIAHDFNNLLNVIAGHSELLLARPELDESIRSDIGTILKCAVTAADLTRQLLSFSHRGTVELSALDANVVIADSAKMLSRLLRESIELSVVLCSEPATIEASRGQLEQIIVNLAVNARDAMPVGGKFSIQTDTIVLDETSAARVGVPSPGAYLRVRVSDTGSGMDRATMARAFEPYFTTKERGKGAGLGLSVVYGVVHNNGGHIRLDSTPGVGTTVEIYWPRLQSADAPSGKSTGDAALPRGSETILLVEDFDHLRNMTKAFLQGQGYSVLEASSGLDAIELVRQTLAHGRKIDLLLSDVVMPGMSGPEAAREISMLQEDIKVLFTSGYTGDLLEAYGVPKQRCALIEKPFGFDALGRGIRAVLDDPAATKA